MTTEHRTETRKHAGLDQIDRLLTAVERLSRDMQAEKGVGEQLRRDARGLQDATAAARDVTDRMASDWRELHERIASLRADLQGVERLVGSLYRTLEEEEWRTGT